MLVVKYILEHNKFPQNDDYKARMMESHNKLCPSELLISLLFLVKRPRFQKNEFT